MGPTPEPSSAVQPPGRGSGSAGTNPGSGAGTEAPLPAMKLSLRLSMHGEEAQPVGRTSALVTPVGLVRPGRPLHCGQYSRERVFVKRAGRELAPLLRRVADEAGLTEDGLTLRSSCRPSLPGPYRVRPRRPCPSTTGGARAVTSAPSGAHLGHAPGDSNGQSRSPTDNSTWGFTCANAVDLDPVRNRTVHGMQGVRGSNPLSSTAT